MNHYIVIGVGALVGVGLAFGAFARPHDMHLPISIEAAESRAAATFAEADSNGDAELTRDEFALAKFPGPGPGRRFMRHLQQGDLGPASDTYDDELFDALDGDGDGMLSREEASSEQRRAAHRALIKQRAFNHLDRDDSGTVSLAEFTQRVQRLRELDENADGEISRDEFRRTMRARRHSG